MLLSKKDIKQLQAKGFNVNQFVKYDREGYAQLKNRNGYCVFYDSKARRCRVYVDRPSGCRVYPVILDEDKGIVTDTICRSRETVTEAEKSLKGKRVVKLLRTIDLEAEMRRLGKNTELFF
jgi:Fe-S-cluster containining protein